MSFYKRFLGTADANYNGGSDDFFNSLLLAVLQPDMQDPLTAEVTSEEVFSTLKSMPRNKSPGPDGYIVEFFLSSWDIVGPLFVSVVQEFFISGQLLKQLNATALALVPKVPHPLKVIDFRPIACCNTVYKCISKIIADRLEKVLPSLISPDQIAFIAGRIIMNNILGSYLLKKQLKIMAEKMATLDALLN